MAGGHTGSGFAAASAAVGHPDALDLLASLVAIAPTNLEDPLRRRYEKPHYAAAVDRIVRIARGFGLSTRVFDPVLDAPPNPELAGVPRPNVVVDLDVGAPERVLILAHYDVVPVPKEQLARWKSPPHTLTLRPDGRIYGRGSNDDLGSGVVPSLLAMRRLAEEGPAPRNVRLLVCCDEETGGAGGVESLKARDSTLPQDDPRRFISGDVALIPDGSPHTTAGSSGVAFLDASFDGPTTLPTALAYGQALVGLHEIARQWTSVYPSPDWPEHGAPARVLTGRASVTQIDLSANVRPTGGVFLSAAHAETDAANQIAESVTLVFEGPASELATLGERLASRVPPPFKLVPMTASALTVAPGALALQLVGQSTHGGYPHRGHNPVPPTLRLVSDAVGRGWIAPTPSVTSTFAVDLRLIPEMALADGLRDPMAAARTWARDHAPNARIDAPPARCRPGYGLSPTHPAVQRVERILRGEGGEPGIFGEYGGTDASSLGDVRTLTGEPLPVVVFGSMDRDAHIHEAEESLDPRLMGSMIRTIYRFLSEP
jgi:acetylornithine deacetylase/succinyl-diaminopimelate desuccinylase-like protein